MAGMLELDFDPETVCRICLSSGTKLFNLYQSTVVDGYILAVPEMISRCLDLQVNTADGLPGKCCTPCKSNLIRFYVFKEKSKRTDQILRAMMPNKETETAPEPPIFLAKDAEEPERPTTPNEPPTLLPPVFTDINIKFEHEETITEHLKSFDEPTENDDQVYMTEDDELVSFEEPEDDDDEENESEPKDDVDGRESVSTTVVGTSPNSVAEYEIMEYEELDDVDDECPELLGCDDCDQLFERSEDLDEHTHKMHNPFKCENCLRTFIREATFLRHIKSCAVTEVDAQKEDEREPSVDVPEVDDTISISTERLLSPISFASAVPFKESKRIKRRATPVPAPSLFVELNCPVCLQGSFKTQLSFEKHMKTHAQMNVINHYMTFHPCHTCRKIFLQSSDLKSHLADVHNSKDPNGVDTFAEDESCFDYQFLEEGGYEDGVYQCGVCLELFDTSDDAKKHIVGHIDKFVCPEEACGCQYDLFARFALHILDKHINGKSHRCKYCETQLDSYDAMQAHLKNDCSERKYDCTHCDKKFFSKKALGHHIFQTKGKRHVCQFCGKSFGQTGELTIHTRMHTNERPFVCTVCNKSYKTSSMRAAHMDTHIEGKTFSCNICDKKLQTRVSYRNHLKRHTQEKQHICQHCGKGFFTRYHLNLHSSKVHEKHAEKSLDLMKEEFDDEEMIDEAIV